MNAFVHLIEWSFVWHPCKNGLVSQRRMQTSARCGSPEISSVWLSLTSCVWWIWVIYWSCRRVSRRSAQRFLRVCGSNFGHQRPPFLSSRNSDLVPKLSTSSRFDYTYIRCYLFCSRSLWKIIIRMLLPLLSPAFLLLVVVFFEKWGIRAHPIPSGTHPQLCVWVFWNITTISPMTYGNCQWKTIWGNRLSQHETGNTASRKRSLIPTRLTGRWTTPRKPWFGTSQLLEKNEQANDTSKWSIFWEKVE